jgi:integrase
VKPFGGVHSARIRYLAIAEARRLVNACDPDFRPLVQAALVTGARYSELTRLTASDFNPDVGTVGIAQSKSGKPRHVVLNAEGRDFFRQLCAGRPRGDLLFRRDDGEPWGKSHQFRLMREACRIAKVVPPIGFHGLRHTWASLSVMAGMPLMVVAKNMGHSDTRMVERHYGHLAPSYVVDAVREHAPTFGFKPSKQITPLR